MSLAAPDLRTRVRNVRQHIASRHSVFRDSIALAVDFECSVDDVRHGLRHLLFLQQFATCRTQGSLSRLHSAGRWILVNLGSESRLQDKTMLPSPETSSRLPQIGTDTVSGI